MDFGSLALVPYKILVHNVKNTLMSYRRLKAFIKMMLGALHCMFLPASF
jgi:hypothetical protein